MSTIFIFKLIKKFKNYLESLKNTSVKFSSKANKKNVENSEIGHDSKTLTIITREPIGFHFQFQRIRKRSDPVRDTARHKNGG